MTTEKSLQTFSSFSPETWEHMRIMAETFVKSKALPANIDNVEKLMMVFQASRDFGLTATEAINGFYFVNGKLTIWGTVGLSQIMKAGFIVKWGKCDDKSATVTISRTDRGEHTETYTIDEATKAGLTNKQIWKMYPKNMLRWKAIGNAARFFCPEALGGFYIKEEIEEELLEGNVVDTEEQPFQEALVSISEAKNKKELEEKKEIFKRVWNKKNTEMLQNAWLEKIKEFETKKEEKPLIEPK